MKKPNATLEHDIAFMKPHLKNSKDFPALIKDVKYILEQFEYTPAPAVKDQRIKPIRSLDLALKNLGDEAQKLLDIDEFHAPPLVVCPSGKKVDLVPLMRKQCAEALRHIKYNEDRREKTFFQSLATAYDAFCKTKFSYSDTGAFVRFCTSVYLHTGTYEAPAAGGANENVQYKVQKYVYRLGTSKKLHGGVTIAEGEYHRKRHRKR